MDAEKVVKYHLEEMLDDALLSWAHHTALMDGGDGWVFVASPRWRELADRYQASPFSFKFREDDPDMAMFHDGPMGQEGITFYAKATGGELEHYHTMILIA